MSRPLVVVHGGALPQPRDVTAMVAGCEGAAQAGVAALGRGAIDAVEAAVRVLEADPIFNAGTGGALTETGGIELDASIMDGRSLAAGAVGALPPFPHPVSVARAALTDRHVFYVGAGAAAFARRAGFEPVSADDMATDRSRRRLAEVLDGRGSSLDTVGAVAVDADGHVAAATSTGGIIGQSSGRVGDSPIIGSGCYADDEWGAVSCTGEGEALIRAVTARAVGHRIAGGATAQQAGDAAIDELGHRFDGMGGLIVVSPEGDVGICFNTPGMSHAVAGPAGIVRSGG